MHCCVFAPGSVLMDDHRVQVCVCVCVCVCMHSSQLMALAAIIVEPNFDGGGYSGVCECVLIFRIGHICSTNYSYPLS